MRRAEHAVAVEGASFVAGIDTPQTHAKWMKELKLALVAKERLKELLAERGLKVMFSGMDLRMQRNERLSHEGARELISPSAEAQ
ncbi:hypothetical protein [Rhizobium leguminosarum]|uniref:hypothetical protein n=1 Tax=Rhizobium leguminosarum TaxID=384 RepID=UPI0021BBBC84|nr:hypothetical protein [Rhizobium leguminosarum]